MVAAIAVAMCGLVPAVAPLLPSACAATPLDAPFQVNTYTANDQAYPAAAAVAGGFVIVWESLGSAGPDDSGYAIQAQRYDASGMPQGDEFQVNTYTTNNQYGVAVAAEAGGGFVVAWQSDGSDGSDASGFSIQARRYDGTGQPLGGQFQVNTFTTSDQSYPAVAGRPGGGFVIAWESFGSAGDDSRRVSIQARLYDATGVPLGDQFQVNTFTSGDQDTVAVAVEAEDGFVVVWTSAGSTGDDGSMTSVQARRYDASGAPGGDEFQVNTYTTGDQAYPVVAATAGGGFVVAWESQGGDGSDDSGYSIQAQRYDDTGAPAGGEFQVNSYTTGTQDGPAVAPEAGGGFVVAWQSAGSAGSDTSGYSIQAQRYDETGTPVGDEFQVNTYTTGNQYDPTVALEAEGRFVIAWDSAGSAGSDTSGFSIQAQRYQGATACEQGECNADGSLTTADVTCVILRIFDQIPAASACEDCNDDGLLTTADVTCAILCLFGTCPGT